MPDAIDWLPADVACAIAIAWLTCVVLGSTGVGSALVAVPCSAGAGRC